MSGCHASAIIFSSYLGNNKEATGNDSSLPPSGYVVAGKMRLGSISVPAPNSAHLRREQQKLTPFRSESINSGSSFVLAKNEAETCSERESISPHREQVNDSSKAVNGTQWAILPPPLSLNAGAY